MTKKDGAHKPGKANTLAVQNVAIGHVADPRREEGEGHDVAAAPDGRADVLEEHPQRLQHHLLSLRQGGALLLKQVRSTLRRLHT